MSIAVDGFKVIKRIGDAPQVFQGIRTDVDKAACALVVKCLKAKAVRIDALRDICEALHEKQFQLIVEGLSDAAIKSLLTRLDKHHPDLKTMSLSERKRHLISLADGKNHPVTPVAKTKKSKKAKTVDEKAQPKRLQFDSVDAYIARREAEED